MSAPRNVIPLHTATSRPAFDRRDVEQRPDDELVELAAAGVDPAFTELVRRYHAQVRRYCARMCGTAQGDELAQEAFLDLWRSAAAYQPRGRFRSYLFTLVHRRCLNARRTPVREPASIADGCNPEQLDQLLRAERAERVRAKVDRLPQKLRHAVLLRFVAELEYAEMAEMLQRPETTVRGRVFSALARLRELLTRESEP